MPPPTIYMWPTGAPKRLSRNQSRGHVRLPEARTVRVCGVASLGDDQLLVKPFLPYFLDRRSTVPRVVRAPIQFEEREPSLDRPLLEITKTAPQQGASFRVHLYKTDLHSRDHYSSKSCRAHPITTGHVPQPVEGQAVGSSTRPPAVPQRGADNLAREPHG